MLMEPCDEKLAKNIYCLKESNGKILIKKFQMIDRKEHIEGIAINLKYIYHRDAATQSWGFEAVSI